MLYENNSNRLVFCFFSRRNKINSCVINSFVNIIDIMWAAHSEARFYQMWYTHHFNSTGMFIYFIIITQFMMVDIKLLPDETWWC